MGSILVRVGMGKLAIPMGVGMGMGNLLIFKKDPAIIHAINLVGCLEDEIHVVRDRNVRHINIFENANYSFRGLRIETRGGLIQKQNAGFHGQDGGEGHKFFLTPR